MDYTQSDVDNMALCAWKEARGEGLYGCFLVMQVIYNRSRKIGAFPPNVHDVIYQRNAFTSMSVPSDPEYNIAPETPQELELYHDLQLDAPNILVGTNDDPTKGAVFYANEDTETSGWYYENVIKNPAHPITLVYKHHTFRL